jgi:hypothetical protein
MIYAFSRALEAALQARGFPYRVVYTPFLDSRVAYGSSIVMTHSRGANERVGGPIGVRRNPKSVLTRYMSADLWTFAQSNKPGAHVGEHEVECDLVVDGVLTAADLLVRASHHGVDFEVPEARYLTQAEREALGGFVEQWPGVVYYTRVVVPRGVARLTYAGHGAPEGVVGEVDTTVEASGAPDDPAPETFEVVATGP